MFTRLKNIKEETFMLRRRHTVIRICVVVETPVSSTATFPLKDKLVVKRKVVAARKHLLFLRMPPVCRGESGEC
jgi:hypothetical protein